MSRGTRLNWLLVMSENLLVSATVTEVSQWMGVLAVGMDGRQQKVKHSRGLAASSGTTEEWREKGTRPHGSGSRCEFASRCLSSTTGGFMEFKSSLLALARRGVAPVDAIGLIHKPHVLFRPCN